MRKTRPLTKVIFDECYRFDLLLIAGCTIETANKILTKRGIPEMDLESATGALACFNEDDNPKKIKGTIYAMYIADRKDFYTLLHEVSHLVIEVFNDKGIPITPQNTETYAYYQEMWFRRLWRLVNKKPRVKSP